MYQKLKDWIVCLTPLLCIIPLLTACSDAAKTATDPSENPTTQKTLEKIFLYNQNPRIAKNSTTQISAEGIYSDNSREDFTHKVKWVSSDENVAVFPNNDGRVNALQAGDITIQATSIEHADVPSETIELTITNEILQSIEIHAEVTRAGENTRVKMTATGLYALSADASSGFSLQDITNLVTWTSSESKVATFIEPQLQPGLLTAVSALYTGQSKITAKLGTIESSIDFFVHDLSLRDIQIQPKNDNSSIALGTTRLGTLIHQNYVAIGIYNDDSRQDITQDVIWTSSNTPVAEISNDAFTEGKLITFSPGTTTISAELDREITSATGQTRFDHVVSNSITLSVTNSKIIEIKIGIENSLTPNSNITMNIGTQTQLVATAIYADLTTHDVTNDVTWGSRYPLIASIENVGDRSGLVTARSAGNGVINDTSIIAVFKGFISNDLIISVSDQPFDRIVIEPGTSSLAVGATQSYTAFGHFANSQTPAQNVTNDVIWRSDTPAIAIINNTTGMATGITPGNAVITAQYDTVISNNAQLLISDSPLNSITIAATNSINIALGNQELFSATANYADGTKSNITDKVFWQSTNTAIATVSNAQGSAGLVSSISAGESNLQISYLGHSDSLAIKVTPALLESFIVAPNAPNLQVGQLLNLTATAKFTTGSQNVTGAATWTSSDNSIVSVSSTGQITANISGSATITALYNNVTATSIVTVSALPPRVDVTGSAGNETSIVVGQSINMIASNGTAPYTWAVNNAAAVNTSPLATINISTGLLQGLGVGDVIVTAQDANLTTGSTTISIQPAPVVLQSIQIKPQNFTIVVRQSVQYTATGFYSDGSSNNLTDSASWSVSDPNFWLDTSTPSVPGLVHSGNSVSQIQTQVLVNFDGISASTTLTAKPKTLTVSYSPTSIYAPGPTIQFYASDGASPYRWSTDPFNSAIATINSATGVLTPLAEGSLTVFAADANSIIGSVNITITGPPLVKLFRDPVLQTCVDDYARLNGGLTTTDQITTLGLFCSGRLTGAQITDLTGMEHLTHLTSLDLSGQSVNNILPISNLTSLTELNLSGNLLDKYDDLAGLTNITTLDLSRTTTAPTLTPPLTALANLTQLTKFTMDFVPLTPTHLSALSQLSLLNYVRLSYTQMTDLSFVTNLTNIEYLYVAGNSLPNIKAVANLSKMLFIGISANTTSVDLTPLKTLASLDYIDMSSININQAHFDSVFGPPNLLPSLKRLSIASTGISDVAVIGNNYPNMTFLAIGDNPLTDAGVTTLNKLPLLDNLYVDNTGITSISFLNGLTNLQYLGFSSNAITNQSELSTILPMTRLKGLDISNTGLSDLTIFSTMTNLTSLYVDQNAITDVGPIAALVNLRFFNVANNLIGSLGVGNVDKLGALSKATSIDLTGNPTMACPELESLLTNNTFVSQNVVRPAIANSVAPNNNCTP